MNEINLKVEGMTCDHCVKTIEGSLGKLGAIARVNLKENRVSVHFDPEKISPDLIRGTIEDQGYTVGTENAN